jgi:hypothetical protein
MRESGFYEVDGKRRHMTDFKADRFRAQGKEVKGPLEDKALKVRYEGLEDKSVGELRRMASEAGISGMSSARKSKLLEVLSG